MVEGSRLTLADSFDPLAPGYERRVVSRAFDFPELKLALFDCRPIGRRYSAGSAARDGGKECELVDHSTKLIRWHFACRVEQSIDKHRALAAGSPYWYSLRVVMGAQEELPTNINRVDRTKEKMIYLLVRPVSNRRNRFSLGLENDSGVPRRTGLHFVVVPVVEKFQRALHRSRKALVRSRYLLVRPIREWMSAVDKDLNQREDSVGREHQRPKLHYDRNHFVNWSANEWIDGRRYTSLTKNLESMEKKAVFVSRFFSSCLLGECTGGEY